MFSYINNLSPIKTVKATHIAPGFPGLSSPPLVFTSPRVNPYSETSFLKRSEVPLVLFLVFLCLIVLSHLCLLGI